MKYMKAFEFSNYGHNAEIVNDIRNKYNIQIDEIVNSLIQTKILKNDLYNEIRSQNMEESQKKIDILENIIHYNFIKNGL